MNTKNHLLRNVISAGKNSAVVAFLFLGLSLGLSQTASADWSGGIEGGTVLNSDGGSSNRLRLKLTNNARPLSHYIFADWLREGTGNSYEVGYKPQYWFGEALYLFGEATVKQDKPRSIDRSLFGLTGVGIQFLEGENHSLFAELGAGYRTTEFDNGSEDDSDTTAIARAGFQQILADLVSLEIDADTNVSEGLTSSKAEAGIAVRIPGGSVKYSYRTRRLDVDGDPLGAQTTSESFLSFGYGF